VIAEAPTPAVAAKAPRARKTPAAKKAAVVADKPAAKKTARPARKTKAASGEA
jgi:hypothetical protein